MSIVKSGKKHESHFSRLICIEIQKYLPKNLLSQVTVLLQENGYVTISSGDLSKKDWRDMNDHINKIGGQWVSNGRFSHWSIPIT